MSAKRCVSYLLSYSKKCYQNPNVLFPAFHPFPIGTVPIVPASEFVETADRILLNGLAPTLKYLTEQLYYKKKDVRHFVEMLDAREEYMKKLETELAELKKRSMK